MGISEWGFSLGSCPLRIGHYFCHVSKRKCISIVWCPFSPQLPLLISIKEITLSFQHVSWPLDGACPSLAGFKCSFPGARLHFGEFRLLLTSASRRVFQCQGWPMAGRDVRVISCPDRCFSGSESAPLGELKSTTGF